MPALRSSSSAQNQTGSTFSVTAPAGIVDNDLLVAIQATDLSSGTVPAAPTGFTLLDSQNLASGMGDLRVWYKKAASESGNYTFNNAGSPLGTATAQVWLLCLSAAVSPPETSTHNSGSSSTATATGITTAQDNEMLVAAFGISSNIGGTITPAVLTDIGSLINNPVGLDAAYITQASAGASGNKTATLSGSLSWGAILVAVQAAAVNYSLDLAAGAFVLTGTAALLDVTLPLGVGSFLVTGTAAALDLGGGVGRVSNHFRRTVGAITRRRPGRP